MFLVKVELVIVRNLWKNQQNIPTNCLGQRMGLSTRLIHSTVSGRLLLRFICERVHTVVKHFKLSVLKQAALLFMMNEVYFLLQKKINLSIQWPHGLRRGP
jgi:hypothetical protein